MTVNSKILRSCSAAAILALGAGTFTASRANAAPPPAWANEAACQSLTMAAAGGSAPSDKDVFALRYMGSSNYELSYRGTVLLFDAQYRRDAPERPLLVTREQLKKVDAIYIGHGHGDHMSDAPFIAKQDNAPMYGAWPATTAAKQMGLPDKLNITVKNGDVQKYPGFTVEAVLARHSSVADENGKLLPSFAASMAAWAEMKKATGLETPPDVLAKRKAEGVQGSNDPHILDQGTIAWLISFDDGYKVLILDSSGDVTDAERAMMQRIGHPNVAIVAYQGFFVAARQIPKTLPLVEEFKPDIFLPDHHDETAGSYPDMATYPLFMAIREKLPATRNISPLYGTPICFNTKLTGAKAAFVGDTWTWPVNQKAAQ